MAIVGVRYDERLIHGQVAVFWTNALRVGRIVVLDEIAANDEITKAALRMAVPNGVRSSIIVKEKFVANYQAGKYEGQRLFIVFRDLGVAQYLLDNGIEFTEINLGNRSMKDGDTRLSKDFCVGKREVEIIRDLQSRGIHIYAKLTPQEATNSVDDLLKKAGL